MPHQLGAFTGSRRWVSPPSDELGLPPQRRAGSPPSAFKWEPSSGCRPATDTFFGGLPSPPFFFCVNQVKQHRFENADSGLTAESRRKPLPATGYRAAFPQVSDDRLEEVGGALPRALQVGAALHRLFGYSQGRCSVLVLNHAHHEHDPKRSGQIVDRPLQQLGELGPWPRSLPDQDPDEACRSPQLKSSRSCRVHPMEPPCPRAGGG